MRIMIDRLEKVEESDIDENGEFTIPDGVTKICRGAFSGLNKLKRINNLENIYYIEKNAFAGCINLESFYIGSSVDSIDNTAFYNCNGIKKFKIHPDNNNYIIINDCLYYTREFCLIGVPSTIEELRIPEGAQDMAPLGNLEKIKKVYLPSTFYKSSVIHYDHNIYGVRLKESCNLGELSNLEEIIVSQDPQDLDEEDPIEHDIWDEDGVLYSYEEEEGEEEVELELLFCPSKKKKLEIPEGISRATMPTALGRYSQLEELYIPSTFKSFDEDKYNNSRINANRLKRIIVDDKNKYYTSIDGMLCSKDGKELIFVPDGRQDKVLKIPEGIETIKSGAINSDTIEEIIIPSSLNEIEYLGSNEIKNGIHCASLRKITIAEDNVTFFVKDGVLYDKERKICIACVNSVKKLTIISGYKMIADNMFAKNVEELEEITIEPDAKIYLQVIADHSSEIKVINAEPEEKYRIIEYVLGNNSCKELYRLNIIGESYNIIERIKQSKLYKEMVSQENPDHIELFLYKMINTIGEEEAESFFSIPNIDSKEVKRLLAEKKEKYLGLYDTKYKVEGKFGVAIEILKLVNNYSKNNNKGKKNTLEQQIIKTINEGIESGNYFSIYEIIKDKLPEIGEDFLELIRQKESKINEHLIERKLEEQEEKITNIVSGANNTNSIVQRQQRAVYIKVSTAIKKSFSKNGKIDLEDIRSELNEELENSSPYISQNANMIIENTLRLLNDSEFLDSISTNAFDCMANVKLAIGDKWRYNLGMAMKKIGYSLEGFPQELSFEELSMLQQELKLDKEIETSPVAILKDKEQVQEAYRLLQEIDYPGLLSWQQIHDMFGSVSYPYSEEFRKYFKEHRKEFLERPEIYQKFGTIQRNFDKIINSKELINIYKKGKLTVDQIFTYLDESVKFSNQRPGDEELAKYAKMYGITTDKEFAYVQKIFDIVRKRERTSVPPMNIQKKKYRGRMLSPDDILNIFAGDITTCCQRFHDVGEASMLLGAIEENAGIFVIEELDENGNSKGIIGQSLTYRQKGVDGHYDRLTFDNIEIANPVQSNLNAQDNAEILEIYKQAAEQAIKTDNEFLLRQVKEGKITREEYKSLRLKEVIAGTGCNDLKGLEKLEKAEVVVSDEAKKMYQGIEQKMYPWIDSANGKSPKGSSYEPVVLARSEDRVKEEIKVAKPKDVPLWYGKTKKVKTKDNYDISNEDIEVIRKIEEATYRKEQQLLESAETKYDLEEIYCIENPVLKIGSNNDWYLLYGNKDDDIEISDLCVYGSLNAEQNTQLEGNNSRLAIAESTYEVYKLLIESAASNKRIYCSATKDTSFRYIKTMLRRNLISLNDRDGKKLVLDGKKVVYSETGKELETRSFDDESDIEMIELEIIPDIEKMEAELGKVEKYLYQAQSLDRTRGAEKEEGDINALRSEIR